MTDGGNPPGASSADLGRCHFRAYASRHAVFGDARPSRSERRPRAVRMVAVSGCPIVWLVTDAPVSSGALVANSRRFVKYLIRTEPIRLTAEVLKFSRTKLEAP